MSPPPDIIVVGPTAQEADAMATLYLVAGFAIGLAIFLLAMLIVLVVHWSVKT